VITTCGDTIHLNIFADRLEVTRQEGLLDGKPARTCWARYSQRHPGQILSDLGFVERLGYGLDRVVRLMQQHDCARRNLRRMLAPSGNPVQCQHGEIGLRGLTRYRAWTSTAPEIAVGYLSIASPAGGSDSRRSALKCAPDSPPRPG
jgi:hypothetical protein